MFCPHPLRVLLRLLLLQPDRCLVLCSQCARKIKNHEVCKYQSCMVSYQDLLRLGVLAHAHILTHSGGAPQFSIL